MTTGRHPCAADDTLPLVMMIMVMVKITGAFVMSRRIVETNKRAELGRFSMFKEADAFNVWVILKKKKITVVQMIHLKSTEINWYQPNKWTIQVRYLVKKSHYLCWLLAPVTFSLYGAGEIIKKKDICYSISPHCLVLNSEVVLSFNPDHYIGMFDVLPFALNLSSLTINDDSCIARWGDQELAEDTTRLDDTRVATPLKVCRVWWLTNSYNANSGQN